MHVALNYSHDGGFANLSFAGSLNWTEKSTFQSAPGGFNRDCVGHYSANCGQPIPEWQWSLRTTLAFDTLDVSFPWSTIGGTKYEGLAGSCQARGPVVVLLFLSAVLCPGRPGILDGTWA